MATEIITDFVNGHVPEVLMILAGILALLIVKQYRSDKESGMYKGVMLLGVILGIVMVVVAVSRQSNWSFFDAVLVMLAGFALVIRPIRNANISLIIGLIVAGLVYLSLGGLTGDLSFLASGWPRIIIALVAGALVYMLLRFLESIVLLFGKILNCWPILAILGIICLAEGILLITGNPSLFNIYTSLSGQ